VPIAARRFSVHPPKSSPVDGFAVPMALHLFGGWHAFDCGISRDQACKWLGSLRTRIIVPFCFGTNSPLQMATISECRSRWGDIF
jgi:hypothetical protein